MGWGQEGMCVGHGGWIMGKAVLKKTKNKKVVRRINCPTRLQEMHIDGASVCVWGS